MDDESTYWFILKHHEKNFPFDHPLIWMHKVLYEAKHGSLPPPPPPPPPSLLPFSQLPYMTCIDECRFRSWRKPSRCEREAHLPDHLRDKKVVELKKLAKERNIKNYTKMKRSDLINVLSKM